MTFDNPSSSSSASTNSSARNSASATSVLDRDRTDQMRAFLTTEAAASVATSASESPRFTGRRLLVGMAVATVVAALAVAVTSVADVPGFSSVGVSPAAAVSVDAVDGWTTVRLLDPDADPALVVDQLHDAGVAAELRVVPAGSDGVIELGPTGSVAALGPVEVGGRGLLGFTVTSPALERSFGGEGSTFVFAPIDGDWIQSFEPSHPGQSPSPDEVQNEVDRVKDVDAALDAAGVRLDGDLSVRMRSDAPTTVVVYAAA